MNDIESAADKELATEEFEGEEAFQFIGAPHNCHLFIWQMNEGQIGN